jgi:hypothetical protein
MNRRHAMSVMGASAAGLVGAASSSVLLAQNQEGAAPGRPPLAHAKMIQECLKACGDCMDVCNMTTHHCFELVRAGKMDHLMPLHFTVDCQEFCAESAKLIGRNSPLMAISCDACAKACDACAAECEKVAGDEQMTRCAKSCRDCAKICRDMVQAMGGAGVQAGSEKPVRKQ